MIREFFGAFSNSIGVTVTQPNYTLSIVADKLTVYKNETITFSGQFLLDGYISIIGRDVSLYENGIFRAKGVTDGDGIYSIPVTFSEEGDYTFYAEGTEPVEQVYRDEPTEGGIIKQKVRSPEIRVSSDKRLTRESGPLRRFIQKLFGGN